MKKSNIKSKLQLMFAATIMAMSAVGCSDYLTDEPADKFTNENFWQSEDNVKTFSWLNYDTFYGYGNGTTIGLSSFYYHGSDFKVDDNLSAFTFYQMPVTASTTNLYSWNEYYTLIRRCNLMLEKIPGVPMAEVKKNHYIGVAKFFRAYTYFRLVQKMGDVPYTDKYLAQNDDAVYSPSMQRAEVIDKAIKDMEEAIDLLLPVDDKNTTVNKYTAYAALSNICIYEGTYRKYHLGQDGSTYLNKAKTASLAVMNNGGYQLNSDWKSLYNSVELAGNTEVILTKRYLSNVLMHSLQNYTNTSTIQYGLTKWAADSYVTTNGLPIQQVGNSQYTGDDDITKTFTNRDPRFGKTVNPTSYGYKGKPFSAATLVSMSGYVFELYNNPATTGPDVTTGGRNYTDAPVFTLSEVYLNYAEACAELGTATNTDLDMSINKVRARAGIAPLTTDGTNASAGGIQINDPRRTATLEQISGSVNPLIWEVRRERQIEFMSWTTLRQMDIYRWKKGDYLDTSKNIDVNLGARIGTPVGTQVVVDGNGYIKIYPASTRTFEAKHYLMNIPTNDIDLYKAQGVELKQNPGW
ncbi:carbohydrate-binding protein SusD [Flavobacterium sp. KMS]|uniref:RagB/SusD family nutrient uptake outer membrane protein n=1 Tax=Flavobacterium sp. KMS TaxID=1566023 RepID=UPI00057DCDF5|nr:RagB/SusD family nutrient uptake outer membrane protein [Flavobacterium sp. KMS]KIC00484.1 carbohydrate-binding protein SusD [Flavobacterium sp. KMS]KIC00589.1 carbohydrate-binding protein SusD [Flavobacterium sp. JRM]